MLALRFASLAVPAVLAFAVGACGPDNSRECVAGVTDLNTDPYNCGSCGNACADGYSCVGSACIPGECQPGTEEECYTGPSETLGVGPCAAGTRVCDATATWSRCSDVHPVQETCGDNVDNNCNGMTDEDIDADGDGFTNCAGNDCCDSTECSKPELVNSGAFDAAGNGFDDDCNGVVDDTILLCDQGIASNTSDAMEFARAIDICQTSTETDPKWGVISASLSLTDGTGAVDPEGHSVRPRFGSGAVPQGGLNLAIISTGGAAARNDTNPGFHDFVTGYSHTAPNTAPVPADFLAANNGIVPNAPGCPAPTTTIANDPVMLTIRVRVPTNALSFKLSTNFYSGEFPEYTCTNFNDFFVVLLDSTYAGDPPNPPDKNLAFYQPAGTNTKVPVGVNLGSGNTGLFTQCVNGNTGCSGQVPGSINTCTGVELLAGTGFDSPATGDCDTNSLEGGATGWLVTTGNVTPGEIITLRIAIWDTGDHSWDSLALIDGFAWSTEVSQPGTVIFTGERPPLPRMQYDPTQNTLRPKLAPL